MDKSKKSVEQMSEPNSIKRESEEQDSVETMSAPLKNADKKEQIPFSEDSESQAPDEYLEISEQNSVSPRSPSRK